MEYGRKPLMKRKPAVVIAIGAGKPEDGGQESLECPKCGARLADTAENREYAAQREPEEPYAGDYSQLPGEW